MKAREERVRVSLHGGWLDGTKAVVLVEGVVETWTRFSPSEGLALRLRHWGYEHRSERWLESTRIENSQDASTIAIKLGPIAVLAPHVWDEVVTLTGNAWKLGRIDFEHSGRV